jgi:hypothetical protein
MIAGATGGGPLPAHRRMIRWDKPFREADTLDTLEKLLT